MITSHELMKKLGIQNAKTLTRWHQQDLIPPPEMAVHPNGRGRIGYWPDWVVPRCVRIRRLMKEGLKLNEIRGHLGTNWQDEERLSKRRYRFRDVMQKMELHARICAFTETVDAKLSALLFRLNRKLASPKRQLCDALANRETLDYVVQLVQQGITPVVISDGMEVKIIPDFLVAAELDSERSKPLFVVPIFHEVRTVFGDGGPDWPPSPQIRPVPRALRVGESGVEFGFQRIGTTDFRLIPAGEGQKDRSPK